jgi:YVTN family beta-propeller protein
MNRGRQGAMKTSRPRHPPEKLLMRRPLAVLLVGTSLAIAFATLAPRSATTRTQAVNDFAHFESGHVHPLAMTPDGTRLLAVNTAAGCLTVFRLTGAVPVRVADIPVGLEPVSVAVKDDGEAWVVNHLSDDVSIVDLETENVRATVRVGDEPSDVVFAGTPLRAWVSVSQEDAVKVYDPADLAADPVVVPIPARKPRSLAVAADGQAVFASVLHGNDGATVLSVAEAGDSLPAPQPPMSPGLPAAPRTGLIVHFVNGRWRDVAGKFWDSKVPYSVPRVELVRMPVAAPGTLTTFGGLATSMFATAVNPVSGVCASAGTEAHTEIRFEPNLRGRTTEGRVALVPPTGPATVVALNPHINYAVPFGPASEKDSSLALPTGAAWSPDGQRLYVTAMGSAKLGVVSAAGALLARVATVAGPTGVVVDGPRQKVYVLGRFHNQLATHSAATLVLQATTRIGFDPTPDDIVNGRRFFYGGATSGHGDQACASCHFFGDFDNLAWDLGDPNGTMTPVPPGMIDPLLQPMHPMKGPMTTQSLRGMPGTGLLHWRGDRNDFLAFRGATQGLLGLQAPIPDSEMVAMSQFVLPLVYPPNPNQLLDRKFATAPVGEPSAERGRQFFLGTAVDGGLTCAFCHTLPAGTNAQHIDRFALQGTQDVKIPHLRNLYQKTGFDDAPGTVNKRGAGFTHDGAIDDLFEFLRFPGFDFGADADAKRRDLEAYLLAFDSGTAPAVGVQVTFDGGAGDADRGARLDTLTQRANAGDCDLVAHGRVNQEPRGWLFSSGSWQSDRTGQAAITTAQLKALAGAGAEITVLAVPRASGQRIGRDRDRDGVLDGDERAAGSDPGDPASTPATVNVGSRPGVTGFTAALPNPFRDAARFEFQLAREERVELVVYDLFGREVRVLARARPWPAGAHSLAWDGRRTDGRTVSAGVYFARLRLAEREFTRTIVKL